jgi:hypothetical protein
MKKLLAVLFTVAALACLTDLVGCKSEEPAAPPAKPKVDKPKTEKAAPAAGAATKPAAEKAPK